jgi:hypothetical protein
VDGAWVCGIEEAGHVGGKIHTARARLEGESTAGQAG